MSGRRNLSQSRSKSQRSQQNSQNSQNSQNIAENDEYLANNIVRYLVINGGSNIPIRKAHVQKVAAPNAGRTYERIFRNAKSIISAIYGYKLTEFETGSSKMYILQNELAPIENQNENFENIPEDVHKILVFLVLTHIYMSNNTSTDAALFAFLNSFEIDVESRHEFFGNVIEYINVTMVKQKYINAVVSETTRKTTYSWGPRAEISVPKMEILQFVSKMYGDKNVKSWTSAYQAANAQLEITNDTEDAPE